MGIFDSFKRRKQEDMAKKNRANHQPIYKQEEVKVEAVVPEPKVEEPVVPEPVQEAPAPAPVVETKPLEEGYNQLDLAVAKLMGTYDGTKAPKPYSTDKSLVMDMVAFAKENKIKLPLFTSDPTRIAKAIAKVEDK